MPCRERDTAISGGDHMSTAGKRNTGHSDFQRILNYAKARRENFNFLLFRYGIERLLYRLSISPHADKFILKGARDRADGGTRRRGELYKAKPGHFKMSVKRKDAIYLFTPH